MPTSALCLKYYLLWYPFKAPYRVEYSLQLSTPHPNSPYEYPSQVCATLTLTGIRVGLKEL